MAITYKNGFIACFVVIYFLVTFGATIYFTHSDFSTFLKTFVWQRNYSLSGKHFFSKISDERWLHLQRKFFGCNLNILWDADLQSNNAKTLTYRCESFCGGLGDRLRGIISSYFLALVLHRKFMIHMRYPCEITHLLTPNRYNWIYRKLKSNATRSKKVIKAIDKPDILSELRSSSFLNEWAEYDDIIIYTNLDLLTAIFNNPAIRQNSVINIFLQQMLPEEANFQSLFSLLFEILFKPTKKVIQLIDPILEQIASFNMSLLCLHIRVGQNPSNPKDQLLKDRSTIADDMITFIEKHIIPKQQNLLMLIASDSNDSISKIKRRFPNQSITIPGPIIHMDRPTTIENIGDGCLTVLATFYVLGECHINILTNSGFSALANRRRIHPYADLYKYNFKEKRIERCEDVISTSQWEPKQSASFVLYCPVVTNFAVQEL